jgi:hypothetical protein
MIETLRNLNILFPEPLLRLRLWWMGCRNIKVEGVCWSFDPPKGRRWAGGIGAVRKYIESGGYVARPRRNPIRLSVDHVPIWTDWNGG